MTSVTRFLRQLPTGMQYYSPPTSAGSIYEFQPSSNNYVGNYSPGAMVVSTDAPALNSWLTTTTGGFTGPYNGGTLQSGWVMRDMGKTIKAGISSDNGVTVKAPGFFREVQVLAPTSVASATAQSTFGVGVTGVGTGNGVPGALPSGGNAGDDGYCTYYLPIVVGGVIAEGADVATNNLLPDGQL